VVLVAFSVADLVAAAFVTAAAFFSALLIRRRRFRASRVRCWYVTAGGTSGTTGGSGGMPVGTGEGVGTPEVDQWELVERLPLGLEQPLSEVRGSPVEMSGLEPPTSEVRGSPVELSGLDPPPIGSAGKPGGTVEVGATLIGSAGKPDGIVGVGAGAGGGDEDTGIIIISIYLLATTKTCRSTSVLKEPP
jgi:hypothetical protein